MAIPFQTTMVDPDGNSAPSSISAPATASLPPPKVSSMAVPITNLLATGAGGVFKPLIMPSTSPDSQFSPYPDSYNPGYIPIKSTVVSRPNYFKAEFALGLKDQLIPGVPNYVLYGAGALALAYVFAKRK